MKFLVDENLPPALAKWLAARGYDAIHVTQDSDYDEVLGDELKVSRVTLGNPSTAKLLAWLEPRLDAAVEQLATTSLVVLA